MYDICMPNHHNYFADRVLAHNCDLISAKSMGMYYQAIENLKLMRPQVKIIGLTATPFRMDSGSLIEGDDRLFDGISYNISIGDLVKQNYLTPVTAVEGISRIESNKLSVKNGEYSSSEQVEAFHENDLTNRAINEIMELASERKCWMIFCANIEHADEVSKILNNRGIKSESVHSKISGKERDDLISSFRRGEYRCLVSVNALLVGFDVAEVDMIAFLRATKSPRLFVQAVGRSMRLHQGKQDALILDFGENILNHGAVDELVERELNRVKNKGKKGEAVMKRCGNEDCLHMSYASVRFCGECGYEFPFDTLPKIQQQAARLAIMSSEKPPERINSYDVKEVTYDLHQKTGKPNSIRVTYYVGDILQFREWVCLNHTGFARKKAIEWVRSRMVGLLDQPNVDENMATSEAILTIIKANQHLIRSPKIIKVNEARSYPEIVSCEF